MTSENCKTVYNYDESDLDGHVERIQTDGEDDFDNGEDENPTEAVVATTTTTQKSSRESNVCCRQLDPDPFYCPSPILEHYDDTIVITDDSFPVGGLPINNSTSESVKLALAGQIFNGQFSTLNVTKNEHTKLNDNNENQAKSEDIENSLDSPPQVVERPCSTNYLSERYITSRIPIHVSPSVTVVHETETDDDDDDDDDDDSDLQVEDNKDRTNKFLEKKPIYKPENKNKGKFFVNEVKKKSVRNWQNERKPKNRHIVRERVVCTVWTSTPRKRRNRLERGEIRKVNSVSNDGVRNPNRETDSFRCDTKMRRSHDPEMRCPWHKWQLDYVSLVDKSYLKQKDSTFPKDWFALHQPLKETDNRDFERSKRRKGGYIENKPNEKCILSFNDVRGKNREKLVHCENERNFGKLEKPDENNTLFPDFFQSETWIKSSDFSGNRSEKNRKKLSETTSCSGDDEVIILNYLKIKNFHPTSKIYTKFFDPSYNDCSSRKINSTEATSTTIRTKEKIWFHFFRFCYSSLPHLSSLDYDYRLEWSDTDRVDHYRLAHPIFIPEKLKWVPLLTHPDGATVFGLQENTREYS